MHSMQFLGHKSLILVSVSRVVLAAHTLTQMMNAKLSRKLASCAGLYFAHISLLKMLIAIVGRINFLESIIPDLVTDCICIFLNVGKTSQPTSQEFQRLQCEPKQIGWNGCIPQMTI